MAILPKCTPLFLYIGVGFAYIDRQRLETISSLMLGNAASILLDMIFRLPALSNGADGRLKWPSRHARGGKSFPAPYIRGEKYLSVGTSSLLPILNDGV